MLATREGTFSYLKRFGDYSRDFYRFDGERFVSTLGLGTYKSEPYKEDRYIQNYADSVKEALRSGINLIDTALNYRYQVSEREIGEALGELFAAGEVRRDQVVVSSKGGFIPLDFPFPDNPYRWIQETVVQGGLADADEIVIDQHCISPGFLRWSVERSLHNLGLDAIDIYFLHNPETQLGYVPQPLLMRRIEEAFGLFEELVAEGKIGCYGVATWNGFVYEEEHTEYLSLLDLVETARRVGGERHHLRYLQLPYNLAKPHPYIYTNQRLADGKYYSLFQAAHALGLQVLASSPLLQMNLFKKPFNRTVASKLGTELLSDVQTALQFARCGGAISALVGTIDPVHLRENMSLAYVPAASHHAVREMFGLRS